MFLIGNVLSSEECDAIRDALNDDACWRDGRTTAKGAAKAVKTNLQADPKNRTVKGVLRKVQDALSTNDLFKAAAQPAHLARLIINRYQTDMQYGDHVDASHLDGVRTDLSFTLFLNSPEDYVGGALVIEAAGREDAIRGERGSLILYPSTNVHRVETVKQGERLACVGWVKSRVKSNADRQLLFELETALADLSAVQLPQNLSTRLANIRNNLKRRFSD